MKKRFCCLVILACLSLLALPVMAEENHSDYEQDARYAEGTPPMVPHRIDNKTSSECLACHQEGLNGAPMTPHPVRLDCTQCHGQGEIKSKMDAAKHDKKSQRKQKERHKD